MKHFTIYFLPLRTYNNRQWSKKGLCILLFVVCYTVLTAQKIQLHYDNGVALSYTYSFDNNYLCKSNYYDSYRIDVILENNSGKKITTRELSINHLNYYKNARIDDKCNSGPEVKFVYETLETGKRISKYYNLLVMKGYPVPRPDYNFNIEFKEVTDNKWSQWETNQCYNQLQYRYKQIVDVMPYSNMYYIDVEIKNGYPENIFFDLSLQNEYGNYIIGKHFGIRAGNVFPQRFSIGSGQNINLQVSKVCFVTDNSKTALCDADRNKASTTPPPNNYRPVVTNPYNIQPGIPNSSNGFSSTNSNSSINTPTTTTNTATTPARQLTPQEWQQQQQFTQQLQQQQKIHDDQVRLQQQNEELKQQQLMEQQLKQQQEQERIARMNQFNYEQTQRTINRMQNTPVQTFQIGQREIKDVKQKTAAETTPDIQVELPEFSANEISNAVFFDSASKNSFEKYLQNNTQRPLGKDNIPLKAIVNVTFYVTEKGNIEDINMPSGDKAYALPVINAVLLSQGKWSPAMKSRTPFKQKLSFLINYE